MSKKRLPKKCADSFVSFSDLSGCCTALTMFGFDTYWSYPYDHFSSEEEMIDYFQQVVSAAYKAGYAVVLCTTTQETIFKGINRALRAAGFISSSYMPKRRYKSTRVKLWYCPANKHAKYRPVIADFEVYINRDAF